MNEFKISDLITLKLEDGKTLIYVDGVEFRQCKYLLLDIPVEQASSFEEIDSIDEAAEKLITQKNLATEILHKFLLKSSFGGIVATFKCGWRMNMTLACFIAI